MEWGQRQGWNGLTTQSVYWTLITAILTVGFVITFPGGWDTLTIGTLKLVLGTICGWVYSGPLDTN